MQKVTDPALLAQLNGGGPAPAPSSAPGVILGRPKSGPSPYQQQQDAESDRRADINTDLSVESSDRSSKGQLQDYRKEFSNSPAVKTYGIAITSLANAANRGDDATGDASLIYDWAKAMDPDSVVRESEVGLAQTGQSVIDTLAARMKKELGYQEGGLLSPENRARLRREIITATKSRRQAYEQQREYFGDIAKRNNLNPDDIVGPHLGEPYRDELSHFGVSGRRFTDAEMAARAQGGKDAAPAVPGAPRDGSGNPFRGADPENITFDMDTGTGAFGSEIEGKRLSAEDQAEYKSFLQANAKNLTPDLLNAWWKSRGFGGLNNADEVVKAARDGTLDLGVDYSAVDAEKKRIAMEASFAEVPEGENVAGYGQDKGLLLNLSDEARGVVGGVKSLLSGDGFGSGYEKERDIERALQQRSREQNGIMPEVVGGLMTPAGVLGKAQTAGQFAKQGALMGAAAGFGEGEGAAESLVGAGAGATVGGVLGGIMSQAPRAASAAMKTETGQKVAKSVRGVLDKTRPAVDREVIAAGERQHVPVRLADAVPSKSRAFAALESNANVGQKMQDALNDDVAVFADRVAGIGGSGRAANNVAQGDMLQSASKRYIARTRQQANTLYSRARQAGGDETVDAAPFIQDVDARIAQLKANGEEANSGVISMLEGMKRDLASGITVGKLQAQRTTLRSRLEKAGLTMDPNQAQLNDALGVAGDTLKNGLSNPAAKAALSEADSFYAERQGFIKGVLKHFTDRKGNIAPETAAKRFDQFIREGGNFRVVQKMFAELEPAERDTIRATVAQSLGRNAKGEFSLPLFLNSVGGRNAALSERSKFLLFGKDGVRALRDLETLASAKMRSGSSINNSRSATVAEAGLGRTLRATISGALGFGGASAVGGEGATTIMATGAAVAAGHLAGMARDAWKLRLALNPKFTKWLRDAPDTTDPAVINDYFSKLNRVASREQTFLMDAQQLQNYLASQFSKGTGRAAAEDNSENDGRK